MRNNSQRRPVLSLPCLETHPASLNQPTAAHSPRHTFAQALRSDKFSSVNAVSCPKLSGSAASWFVRLKPKGRPSTHDRTENKNHAPQQHSNYATRLRTWSPSCSSSRTHSTHTRSARHLRASAPQGQPQLRQRRQLPEALRQRHKLVAVPEGAVRQSADHRTTQDHATHSRHSAPVLSLCSPLAHFYP